MRSRIIPCFLLFISSKWTAQGQSMMCTEDAQCRAFGTPTCGWGGFCDTPSSHTDCNYLGAGTGKMIEIDFTPFCTRTCSAHSDCSHHPTAKVCQTDNSFPNYNTCVECKNSADCTVIGFKNHICPEGFCKHPNSAGTDCRSSDYCLSRPNFNCYDDAIRCWATCEIDSDCGASEAKCLLEVAPGGGSVCSFPANFPPSAGSPSTGCANHDECPTAAAAYCDDGSCTACYDDSHYTHLSSTLYCSEGTCTVCKPSDNNGCSDPTAAKCDTSTPSYSCVACTGDADCQRFTSTPYCGGAGECVICSTSDNSGCTDIAASKCSFDTNYQCTACSNDDDCAHLSSTPYCEGSVCRPCKTSDNSGCTTTTLAKCTDTPSYQCTTCSINADCTRFTSTQEVNVVHVKLLIIVVVQTYLLQNVYPLLHTSAQHAL